MKDKIIIIGAGRHGHVCAEIAELNGYKKIVFLDDNCKNDENVIGVISDLPLYVNEYDVFIGIGDNSLRKKFFEEAEKYNCTFATLIHPQSFISKSAVIGKGSVIMACSVVNTCAVVCKGVIINTCSSVDHNCYISDFCHIGVGAHLSGTVILGQNVFVGAGATIINNISVSDDVILGAGATVINNILENGTYVGVPVRKIQ